MQRFRRLTSNITALIMLAGLIAASTPATASAASNSLGVNPRRDYTVNAGAKLSDTLYVSNLNMTEALNINIQLVDFGSADETGAPKLLLNRKEPTRYSLKPYLTIAQNKTIAAGKSVEVPFSINIPANVGAGSYYGAIKYSTSGEEAANNNIGLASSAVTLLFVRVPGEANDAMQLQKFGPFTPDASGKSGSFGSYYGGQAPKYLSYRVSNKGNVAEQPSGSILMKNIFGKQVKIYAKANPNNNTVLIDQTRRIDLCMNESHQTKNDAASGREVEVAKCNATKLWPGRYTAKLTIIYGDSGNGSSSHELGAVTSFWYIPLWSVVVILAGLAAIAGFFLYIRRIKQGSRRQFNGRR